MRCRSTTPLVLGSWLVLALAAKAWSADVTAAEIASVTAINHGARRALPVSNAEVVRLVAMSEDWLRTGTFSGCSRCNDEAARISKNELSLEVRYTQPRRLMMRDPSQPGVEAAGFFVQLTEPEPPAGVEPTAAPRTPMRGLIGDRGRYWGEVRDTQSSPGISVQLRALLASDELAVPEASGKRAPKSR